MTRGKKEFETTVELSHVMAAPASEITVNGLPAAEDCDAAPLPSVGEPVVIDWDPVTQSHPEIGGSGPVEIVASTSDLNNTAIESGFLVP